MRPNLKVWRMIIYYTCSFYRVIINKWQFIDCFYFLDISSLPFLTDASTLLLQFLHWSAQKLLIFLFPLPFKLILHFLAGLEFPIATLSFFEHLPFSFQHVRFNFLQFSFVFIIDGKDCGQSKNEYVIEILS